MLMRNNEEEVIEFDLDTLESKIKGPFDSAGKQPRMSLKQTNT